LAKVRRRGATRHAAVMLLDVGRGTGGRRLGRQLASLSSSSAANCDGGHVARVLLVRESGLRRRRAGEAHERWWRDTGGARAKLTSDGGGAGVVAAAAGLAAACGGG
jgi:hypothetical protein